MACGVAGIWGPELAPAAAGTIHFADLEAEVRDLIVVAGQSCPPGSAARRHAIGMRGCGAGTGSGCGSWQDDQRTAEAPGGGARRDDGLPRLAGTADPGRGRDAASRTGRAWLRAAAGPPADGRIRPPRDGGALAPGRPSGRARGAAVLLGVHRPAVLGALAPVLGPRGPARP